LTEPSAKKYLGLSNLTFSMIALSKLSMFIIAGILLMLLGLLLLGLEDIFLDESLLLRTLYILPIGCFFSSFIAFIIAARNTSK
jgi:hypothetical protein